MNTLSNVVKGLMFGITSIILMSFNAYGAIWSADVIFPDNETKNYRVEKTGLQFMLPKTSWKCSLDSVTESTTSLPSGQIYRREKSGIICHQGGNEVFVPLVCSRELASTTLHLRDSKSIYYRITLSCDP